MKINTGPVTGLVCCSLSAVVMAVVLIAVFGCGTRQTEQGPLSQTTPSQTTGQDPAGPAPASDQTAAPGASATTAALTTHSRRAVTAAHEGAGTIHRITLSNKRCIEFEPQWTTVHLGESITWRSELETPITIYVSPGVFSRLSFRVRPGATIDTGPAMAAGRFSFWTEPAACREAPRGVLYSGPGVSVEENLYASRGSH